VSGGTNIFNDTVGRVLIGILVIFFVVFAGPYLAGSLLEKMYRSSLESELIYSVSISTTAPLSQVTLFIPLPVDRYGISPVIEQIGLRENGTAFTGWNFTIFGAHTESYLKMWTDGVAGPLVGQQKSIYSFTIVAPADSAFNTQEVLQYDYVLLPKKNLTNVPCAGNDSHPQCYRYTTILYRSYRAAADTNVEVQVNLLGVNRWHILDEYKNFYSDHLDAGFTGPAEGWDTGNGWMQTSEGDENPFWKEPVEKKNNTRLTPVIDTSMMRWHTFTPLP
jgi:hypothetical protein